MQGASLVARENGLSMVGMVVVGRHVVLGIVGFGRESIGVSGISEWSAGIEQAVRRCSARICLVGIGVRSTGIGLVHRE